MKKLLHCAMNLDSYCAIFVSFYRTQKAQRNEHFKKRLSSRTEKKLAYFFLLLPSMADHRQQYLTLHKVFWQSLCKIISAIPKTLLELNFLKKLSFH